MPKKSDLPLPCQLTRKIALTRSPATRTESAPHRTYRSARVRLQAFAEAADYTPAGTPLTPAAIPPGFLADYFFWLRKQTNGRDGQGELTYN